MYYKTYYESPIGKLTLVSNGASLVGLWIEGQKYFESTLPKEMKAGAEKDSIRWETNDKSFAEGEEDSVLRLTGEWLDRYFTGRKPEISELPLAPAGSEFRKIIWRLLCEIPYGSITTYGELAKKAAAFMGRERMSAQAVGGAVGHNPIAVIIPCHRVVGSDAGLTGYAGGIDIKAKLLEFEGVNISKREMTVL